MAGCLIACQKEITALPVNEILPFDSIPVVKLINPIIEEGSGIADSKANPGYLWVQEDSGNPAELFLLSYNGVTLKKIYIKNSSNRDWEDIALSGSDLYIADIGDNQQVYTEYTIYRVPEPISTLDTANSLEAIKFKYPDGSHDAEAFLIDPSTKDIYIITKRDVPAGIYKLSYPYSSMNTVILVTTLPFFGITGAALSFNGKEIIIRTYLNLYLFSRTTGQSIEKALQSKYIILPYISEPQGEAVTFANDNSGFFTLSEKGVAPGVNLYFYKRR
ncbi:MAG: hypothetical protein WBC06_18220 [Chitinophagaceae bacterium]